MRWVTRTVAAVLVLLALAWAVLHWGIVPRIDEFRPRLQGWASGVLSVPVTIGSIEADSNGLVPSIVLHDVQLHDATGRPGLRLARTQVALSVLSLARGGLEQLVLEAPALEIRRTAQGRLLVAGLDLSGDGQGDLQVADWFFAQPEVAVLGGEVRWVDETRSAAPLSLTGVDLVFRNGRRRHQMRLDATPPPEWGQRFVVMGQFRQPLFSRHAGRWQDWDGKLFGQFDALDVSRLRERVDLGVDLLEGNGAVRAWVDVQRGGVTNITADLALARAAVQFGPQRAPLAMRDLSGRIAWQQRDGVTEVSTRALQFHDAHGVAWPGGNLRLVVREAQPARRAAGGELRADRLDLAALARIVRALPIDAALQERLRAHDPHGLVEALDAQWQGPLDAPTDWRVRGQVTGLSLQAQAGDARPGGRPAVPGVDGARAVFEATPAGGHADLDIRDGALEFPGVFEEPRIPLQRLSAKTRWRVQGEHVAVDVDDLSVVNADAQGSFQARWQTSDPQRSASRSRYPGVLDLQGSFARADGARVHRYLPLDIPADARHYVRDAVREGQALDVAVRVRGDLHDVPFDKNPAAGEFRFAGKVQGVTLAYLPRRLQPAGQPAWPVLTELGGELMFERNSMQVRGARAAVQGQPGWRFPKIEARIPDLAHTRVLVSAEGRGPVAAALGIVRQSPLAQMTDHVLDPASASGDAGLKLELDLPIADINAAKVRGAVELAGNDVRLAPDALALAGAHGVVGFTESGFSIHDVRVRVLGGDARLSGGSRAAGSDGPLVQVRAHGTATVEGLRQMRDWRLVTALAQRASGSATYDAVLGFRGGDPDVAVSTDLRGVAIDLPAPLGKPAAAAWPLKYENRRTGATRDEVHVSVADVLSADYERDGVGPSARVLRGRLTVGAQVARTAPPAAGVQLDARVPRMDVDAWSDALNALSAEPGGAVAAAASGAAANAVANDYLPSAFHLRADELTYGGRTLNEVVANAARKGSTWSVDVDARQLKGRIEYREGPGNASALVFARLSRLTIPPSTQDDAGALLTEPPSTIPALDVVVDDLELRGKKLGRLELQAVNRDAQPARTGGASPAVQEWQLTKLNLKTPEATLSAHGTWAAAPRTAPLPTDPRAPRAPDERRHTALDFTLDIQDAGLLLARFGMDGAVSRGKGQLAGRIGWQGSPFSPHYPSLTGQVHLDVGAGQFLKAEPGAAKLLGVLSLQALPRRLALDFRDVFSPGFAFDFVRGDVALNQGVASTNNLQMKGASAAVLMRGKVDVNAETQDLRVVVVPEIDAGTAALVATAINPAIGIGTFLAHLILKQPLIQANTQEFQIGGSWDNPVVTKLDNPARRASQRSRAEPSAPAASTPEPMAPPPAQPVEKP